MLLPERASEMEPGRRYGNDDRCAGGGREKLAITVLHQLGARLVSWTESPCIE